MGIEVIACPTCGAAVRFSVPLGGSVLDVTETPPGKGEGTVVEETERAATVSEKHRTAACPEGHEFGVRFSV